jgi:NAD(P)-dependent dehydrogenase (short-subunit alcohol dehydrogenase family)
MREISSSNPPGFFKIQHPRSIANKQFTRGLSIELADEGIRPIGMSALIYADMHADGGEPEGRTELKSTIPMKRGDNEEIAKTTLWLLPDEASYSTGTFIDITGVK